jgi:hypothetical protein
MATGGWNSHYGSFGHKLQAPGKSDAALIGDALLAMDGLRRGVKIGVAGTYRGRRAESGYKFGGPLGAAIGGITGAGPQPDSPCSGLPAPERVPEPAFPDFSEPQFGCGLDCSSSPFMAAVNM